MKKIVPTAPYNIFASTEYFNTLAIWRAEVLTTFREITRKKPLTSVRQTDGRYKDANVLLKSVAGGGILMEPQTTPVRDRLNEGEDGTNKLILKC